MPAARYRLSLNENLFVPRDVVEEVLVEAAKRIDARLYEDPYCDLLRERLAELLGVDGSEVLVASGADGVIELAALEAAGLPAAVVEPTFESFRTFVDSLGGKVIEAYLAPETFELDADEALRAAEGAAVIYLGSPNNPTGNALDGREVEGLAERFSGLVVVDEAYVEYCGGGLARRATEFDNLLVVRTFSKAWALAGLRVGYGVGSRELVSRLHGRLRPYAVSSLSQMAALLMLERGQLIGRCVEECRRVRAMMLSEMSKIEGVRPFRSDASFIMFRTEKPASEVRARLLEEGFEVKDVSSKPLCGNALRVTVPPEDIAREFIEALKVAAR